MSRATHTPLNYRPGLDGLRGIAVLAVLVFHLWPTVAKGGWLGVDLFFVLSGYLITTLLVREYARTGGIDLVGFWLARARRLMPTLVVVLLAVIVTSAFWTIPSRRGSVAHDVLATLFYYANWHFLLGDEAYFSSNGTPSPLRHAWSLAIEEQYYLLFPLLLLALTRFLHRRRQLALVFGVLALASAAWMAHLYVPGVDPTRVYYGTDTRAFELLVGACAGAWVGPSQWGHAKPSRWLLAVEKAAWPCLVILVAWFFSLTEETSMLFHGGLLMFCLVALVPILAAASPHANAFQRALSFEPLRRFGLISYALYLWHWPVHVFLTASRLGTSEDVARLAQAVVAFVAATGTYLLVERPVRRAGVAALWPFGDRRTSRRAPRNSARRAPWAGRVVATAAVVSVLAGAWVLPQIRDGGSSVETGSGGSELSYRLQPYTPGDPKRVTVVGNSVPHSLMANFPTTQFPDLLLTESVSFGCTTFEGQEYSGDKPLPPSAACRTFHSNWSAGVTNADAMLYFVPQNLLHDYLVDGRRLAVGSPEHDAFVRSSLTSALDGARRQQVKHPIFVNLSCHRMPVFNGASSAVTAINDDRLVTHLNSVTAAWARDAKVPLVDQYGFLCAGDTYHGTINGKNLYADALHFTNESAPIFWNWLAPQVQRATR